MTQLMTRTDSQISKLVSAVSLSDTDTILIDILDELTFLSFSQAQQVAMQFGKHHTEFKKWLKNAPPKIEKPSSRPKPPPPKKVFVQGKDLKNMVNTMIGQLALSDAMSQGYKGG